MHFFPDVDAFVSGVLWGLRSSLFSAVFLGEWTVGAHLQEDVLAFYSSVLQLCFLASHSIRPLKLHCSNDDLSSAVVDIILATVPVIQDRINDNEREAEVEAEASAADNAHSDRYRPEDNEEEGNYNEVGEGEADQKRDNSEHEQEQRGRQGEHYEEEQVEINTSSTNNVQISHRG